MESTGRVIHKDPARFVVRPNLRDYAAGSTEFSWEWARSLLDGLPEGRGLNIAHEAVDRHVARGQGATIAIRWLGKHGESRDISYAELSELSSAFANLLVTLGVEPGERVFSLLGRTPELFVVALGTLKHRAVFCPLFSAFGPEPVRQRLALGDARVLVTKQAFYDKKVAAFRDTLPGLEHVILVDDPGSEGFSSLLGRSSGEYRISATRAEEPALLHFTSGTTGTPKGALHVHEAVVMHNVTGRLALDLHAGDIFWCTADPGWVTGTSYGIIAPLTNGATLIVDEAEFDAERWYRTLAEQKVAVWYTAPTAIRMLMKAGDDLPAKYDLSRLRFCASVGEPLNPEAVIWGADVLGRPFHDNWWQTETGGIMISNFAALDVKPGSMGRPLPGVVAAIVRRTDTGGIEEVAPGEQGELALRPGWPSMFRAYLNAPERYAKCFVGGWYLSGDLARCDGDGYFWFVGRADDVIKTAGHLVGPFEVESVLLEHPAVAEAAVIGIPDAIAMETIKAFVALHAGFTPSAELHDEILALARKRLGAAVAPKQLAFADDLPKTKSGKIMRRLLKARELGLAEGDTSTLEGRST